MTMELIPNKLLFTFLFLSLTLAAVVTVAQVDKLDDSNISLQSVELENMKNSSLAARAQEVEALNENAVQDPEEVESHLE
ncbi:hypothetical protein Tco_0813680, partial [Tanacetum coccineum]